MKQRARFTRLNDRLERYSAVLLRLALGTACCTTAVTCWRNPCVSWPLPVALVWLLGAGGLLLGGALILGFRVRAAALLCGLWLWSLSPAAANGSPTALAITAAAGAFALAARESHPWSLDAFFKGDWLPVGGWRG